ncbi:MAG TPA: PilZ domain-containing protein [Pyrinomonadaceae bacterium]|jgi:hypothetical protein
MFSAWDIINNNRRIAPRHKIRLPASVSLVEKETDESLWPSILAYTRDVSLAGLALVVPTTRMGCHELGEGDYLLKVILAISHDVSVQLIARLMHCGVLSEDEAGAGYLVGAKIEEISAEDRALYEEFIGGLH